MPNNNLSPQWWPLALSEEVKNNQPLARSCASQDYVLFRDKSGTARALEDRCRHRRVALSLGRITEGGLIECGYHGWTFEGSTGQCRIIPNLRSDETIPSHYKAAYFATNEQNGIVYVWSGTPESASPFRVPTVKHADSSQEWTGSKLLSVPHSTFVGALLDGPHTVIDVPGIKILAQRFGDPQYKDNITETEFVADWSEPPKREGCFLDEGIIPDYPFTVHTNVEKGTGQALVEFIQNEEKIAFSVVINSAPMRESVTAVQWRLTAPEKDPKIGTFNIYDNINAEALAAIGNEGLRLWQSSQ